MRGYATHRLLIAPTSALQPPAGALMPPMGALAPPSAAAVLGEGHAQAGVLLDGLSGDIARAGERARALARQAVAGASDNAPELKRQAVLAAAAASAVAGEGWRAALGRFRAAAAGASQAWRASAAAPGRRRKFAALAVAGALGAGLAIFLAVQLHANALARRDVPLALDRYGLRGVVSYTGVSASVFGAVTLQGVTLRLGDLTIPAASLTVDHIDIAAEGLRGAAMRLRGAAVPLLALARMPGLRGRIAPLLGLGFVTPVIDASAAFSVDNANDTTTLLVALRSEMAGQARINAQLGALGAAQIARLLALAGADHTMQYDGASMLQRLGQEALDDAREISWKGGEITLDDGQLFARMQQIPQAATPGEAAALRGRVQNNGFAWLSDIMPPSQMENSRDLLRKWLANGGRLVITSAPSGPVPLVVQRASDLALAGISFSAGD